MSVLEKKHRLSKENYIGELSIAFTICLKDKSKSVCDVMAVNKFTEILVELSRKERCMMPVYCFMPNHQHLIITGLADDSDVLKVIKLYKQKTGFWLSRNMPDIEWQKGFYDHIIKNPKNVPKHVRYILDNPVRKKFVSYWDDYSFKGAIGCDLKEILRGII